MIGNSYHLLLTELDRSFCGSKHLEAGGRSSLQPPHALALRSVVFMVCVDLLLQEAMATVVAGVVGTGAVVAAATGVVAGAATEGGTAEEVGVSETLDALL